ncbi:MULTISPECIES: cell division protein FtsQ [Anaerofustis]|uniref:cell division protein FtsQ n=1 Tax=Anaerofustis TaxID=264995 RepID=UPI0011070302|nr:MULTISPECIES: cell division protein FtsQ [Anaerofustis]MCO8193408.1 cell division protein FtsQ [Anaerofustis sp. NSJ-163]
MNKQTQNLMIFILSMALYGIATLFTELIPSFQIGIIEISVEYFLFIPLTLAMLFSPLPVALGAATGEIVFSEIMLGQFGGIGELEKFITLAIGIYIAGRMVKDPKNKKMVAIAAISGVIIQQFMGCCIDILKVQFAIEEFEAVAGLPESVFFTEGFAFLNDVLFSGILFCMLPTIFLAPKLYGKIEPLLGMRPRNPQTSFEGISPKIILSSIGFFILAIISEFLAENGMALIEWEAEWAGNTNSIFIGIIVAFIISIITLFAMKKKKNTEVK